LLTPSMEEYLKKIYYQASGTSHARVKDIASSLNVVSSSVTRMFQKLDAEGYGVYRKYLGFSLTVKGRNIAKDLIKKHQLIESFLNSIGVSENIHQEVSKIEHAISPHTLTCIENFISFFRDNPDVKESYIRYCQRLYTNQDIKRG
jgi:Mn-dependent DtxR family transcriptional regulator